PVQPAFYKKNIKLILEGWVYAEDMENTGTLAVQVIQGDSSLYWNTIELKQKISKNKAWTFFTDTFVIARSLMSDYKNEISTFLWNTTGKGKTLADDFYVKIAEQEMPSYTPDVTFTPVENYSDVLFKGNFYSVVYDKKSKAFCIGDKNNVPLTSPLIFYEEIIKKDGKIEQSSAQQFLAEKKNDSCIVITCSTGVTNVKFEINCSKNTPGLDISLILKSIKEGAVKRQSLVCTYKENVDKVYRKNTVVDTADFQQEYWLDKEGFSIGKGDRSLISYRNSSLSSTQLNTKKKLIAFNFDYAFDHSLMQFPLRSDNRKGVKTDVSANMLQAGDENSYEINLFVGSNVLGVPVFMQQPYGYKSAFIITEHADYTDLLTNYAVYFGSSDITSTTKAIGGFAKYKIPVTKSIFYHNPDKTNNREFNGAFTSEMCCWKSNKAYQQFITDLYKNGYEIAFHTPDYKTTKREYMEEALSALKEKFGSKVWIDHGYDNGKGDNREDLVCDGLVPGSPNYSLDLWNKYGVKYFWNCYNEDSLLFGSYNFSNKMKNPYIGYGDNFPTPVYWKNKRSGENVVSWPSHIMMDYKEENLWDYYFDSTVLFDLAQNRETVIGHMYPARVDSVTTYYNKTEDGKYVVNPKFDAFLGRLAWFHKNKLIYATTIGEYMDYRQALEKVKMKIMADGRVRIENTGQNEIKGFTICLEQPLKKSGYSVIHDPKSGTYLYSFDFKAGENRILE
ncbi:MAG TPA: hypothetical protein VGF30_02990, partial [Bacteroidia bacterium]